MGFDSIQSKFRKDQSGITLLELIIAVWIIIVIVATLISPSISVWLYNHPLRSATSDIFRAMRIAQVRAVLNNIEYRAWFDQAGKNCAIHRNRGDIWIDNGKLNAFPEGIQIKDISLNGNDPSLILTPPSLKGVLH